MDILTILLFDSTPSLANAMNRSQTEIDKFSELAHQWWDEAGSLRTLHQLNPVRLGWIERACGGLADKTVLDIGCGGGIDGRRAAQAGCRRGHCKPDGCEKGSSAADAGRAGT